MIRGFRRCYVILPFTLVPCLAIYGLLVLLKNGDYSSLENRVPTSQDLQALGDKQVKPLMVVHFDLKGSPPRLSYLQEVMVSLFHRGCNAILMEYEDMFPYDGPLKNISAKNAYSKTQIRKLLALAHDLNMEIIPLVQTFGHLEFVLKLEEFRHLRELDPFAESLCPSKVGSMSLIEEMISQIMSLHPGTRHLHIGCDEVYQLAACGQCSQKDSKDVYSDHVVSVAQMIKSKYPGVKVLIWDDMMRKWLPQYLKESQLTVEVEPMVWAYGPDVTTLVPNFVWHWYTTLFETVWVAGAYKGATEPMSEFPDVAKHFSNQRSWLKVISHSKASIGGIVLTGWSRYSHFSVLCELLPVSIPSLYINLAVITDKDSLTNEEIYNSWLKDLKCPSTRPLNFDPYHISKCNFQGSSLYQIILFFTDIRQNVNSIVQSIQKNGWFTDYNIRHNITSTYQLVQSLKDYKIYESMKEVSSLINRTRESLLMYFDSYTADEWIELKIIPIYNQLKQLTNTFESSIKHKVWPRRPIL